MAQHVTYLKVGTTFGMEQNGAQRKGEKFKMKLLHRINSKSDRIRMKRSAMCAMSKLGYVSFYLFSFLSPPGFPAVSSPLPVRPQFRIKLYQMVREGIWINKTVTVKKTPSHSKNKSRERQGMCHRGCVSTQGTSGGGETRH